MTASIRKSFLCLLLTLMSGAALLAQVDHQWAKEDVLADPTRWGGTFGM